MNLPRSVLLLARELGAGGSERQLAETAKALHRNGWNVHAGCFHDNGIRAQELRTAGIPVVRFPVTSFRSLSALTGAAALRRYIRRHRIALTHSFDMPLNIFSTFATIGAPRAIVSSQRCYRELYSPSEQKLLRVTDKLVNGIVVNCEAIRQHMIRDEGVSPERVHVCYNGLDTSVFFPAPVASRPNIVISTVSVLRPEKGLPTLIEAFASVRRDRSGIKLLIVGSGPMQQRLEDMARELGVAADIHFEPATRDVARWLNASDIFVLPSLSEALSNSLMEAMACGVAPIASNTGGNPELVREGVTGLLFPKGDARALAAQIRRLVDDPALRQRFSTASAALIRTEMTVDKAAARMAEIYTNLLSNSR